MPVFTTYAQNPLVPSQSYFNRLLFSPTQLLFNLAFPMSFEPAQYYLSTLLVCVDDDDFFTDGTIVLPDARLGSPGNGAIICNKLSEPVSVLVNNADEVEVIAIQQGKNYLVFLTDNTSKGGEWLVLEISASVINPVVEEIAGQGLKAYNSKLNVSIKTNALDAPITITDTIRAELYEWTGATGSQDLDDTLLTQPDFFFYAKNATTENGVITFVPLNGKTIDGQVELSLVAEQSCIIVYDGTNWQTIGLGLLTFSDAIQFTNDGIRVKNGTAALPSYSFINATSTGIFNNDNDVAFTVNATEIASIEDNGIDLHTGMYMFNDVPEAFWNDVYP